VLLGDLDAGVAEQDRNLIARHPASSIHCECVAEHVWMTTLRGAVRLGDVS